MLRIFIGFTLIILTSSCSPTNWLRVDVIVPAEYTFPDTGKIVVLNTSYLPEVMYGKASMMADMTSAEKLIFDTLITTNLFNGFFSVLNESPNENLRNSEYIELRESDTINFLHPKEAKKIEDLCTSLDAKYIIAMEYYGFKSKRVQDVSEWSGWEINLDVSFLATWRIYNNKGEILDQVIETDTLYWYSNYDYYDPVPELPDAVREAFFIAGENYAKRISPFWRNIARSYYQIYSFGNDISLDRGQLLELKTGGNRNQAFKACYNLAVVSESEDKLQEAIAWLKEAKTIKESEYTDFYMDKLQKRMEIREKLDIQSGIK